MSKENISIEHLDLPCTCLEEERELYYQPKRSYSFAAGLVSPPFFLSIFQYTQENWKIIMGQLYFLKPFAC